MPPGDYTLRVVPVYKGKEGREIRYSFIITPPFWRTWWFYGLLVLLGIVLALFVYRIYSLRKIRKVELESQINKLRFQAIQSQMNPHFIFNSINAIQESVLYEKKEETYQHINKFSKLVRLTLNFSKKELVSLQEELELLQLYIDLERIRFSDAFEFEIDTQADLNLLIPPMLIQPILENAIIHGLFHKRGEKKLSLRIAQKDTLFITIEDNGIGREASREIKKQKRKEFEKSFATSSIEERLNILRQKHNSSDIGVEYVDLYDVKDNARGTRVIIKLPVIQYF